MIKKLSVLFLFTLFQSVLFANMAQPIDARGGLGSRPYTSQYVDIVHENLYITLNKDFTSAHFRVEYHIRAQKSGTQIPILFYASDFLSDFTITLDGEIINIAPIPSQYQLSDDTLFSNFAHVLGRNESEYNNLFIDDSPKSGFQIHIKDMLYFEANISEGEHIIVVNYDAYRWRESQDMLNKYSFRYALSPAKYWKSFGTLDVYLDANGFDSAISTNLGSPNEGVLLSQAMWHFDSLPVNVLEIYYTPEISWFAKMLITISPLGLATITLLILMFFHLKYTSKFRQKYPNRKVNTVGVAGVFIVTIAFTFSWLFSFPFINWVIGSGASDEGGYRQFFILLLSPVVLAIYSIVFTAINYLIKSKE